MTKLILPILLLMSLPSISQSTHNNSTVVDARVKEVESASADTLASQLTAHLTTDLEKVRSIFKWITDNIEYDTKGYYNLDNIYKGLFQPNGAADSATVYRNYNDNIVRKVLKEKVAICDGYTRLFKKLCDEVGIKAEIVTGYVRWYTDAIGEQTRRIHAWNAVQINNHWYLLDPTWASGFSNTAVTSYKKAYDEYYFLTSPEQLINDHFPLDSKWQLVFNPITIGQFYDQPYLFSAFRKFNIQSYKPSVGIIDARVGDEVLFELETIEAEKEMHVFPSLIIDSTDLAKTKRSVAGNKVACLYNLDSNETKEFNVIYNGELAMRYRVRLKK